MLIFVLIIEDNLLEVIMFKNLMEAYIRFVIGDV